MKVAYSFIRELLEQFEKSNDVFVSYYSQGIEINVNDWEGINEYYQEVMRDYDKRVETIKEFIEKSCKKMVKGLCPLYMFDDFSVSWCYCSYDI